MGKIRGGNTIQASVVLGDLKNPADVKKLQQILEELYDLSDPIYTETAPNGSIESHRGKLAIYKNGSVYEKWINVDGGTVWSRIDAIADMSYANTRFEVGTFSINMATASGTQEVNLTGAFQPKAVIFFACQNSTVKASVGLDDGTTKYGLNTNDGGVADNVYMQPYSIFCDQTPAFYSGYISSLDSDGFTITWTKTGSPTGTLTVAFLAFR